MCDYLQLVLEAVWPSHTSSKTIVQNYNAFIEVMIMAQISFFFLISNGSNIRTDNYGNHILGKEMDHFIPATKPQVREQTLVLRQDAKSTSHAVDGRSLIVCHQNFLKSLDYWNSLPKAISGRILHQIWMQTAETHHCLYSYNQITPFSMHDCERKPSKNCYKNIKQHLGSS